MRVHHFTPYNSQKEFADELNYYASLVKKPEDWICFRDCDTMFLTSDAPQIIEENIKKYPQYSFFSCMSNRIGTHAQKYEGKISDERDILRHYRIAVASAANYRNIIIPHDRPVSGLMMLIQKKVWTKIGGTDHTGIYGVDNQIAVRVLRAGLHIGIMRGIYLLHYYRMHKHRKDISHLR